MLVYTPISGIGTLKVYKVSANTNMTLFNMTGNKGQKWIQGQVTIQSTTPYGIVFEGVRGSDYHGDIALDDILLSNGICSLLSTPVSTLPSVAPTQGGWWSIVFLYW